MNEVKNTSIAEKLLSLIAPHHCFGCQREGSPLCAACAETVVNSDDLHCFVCNQPTFEQALCKKCRSASPLESVCVAASHDGLIERLIYAYKFERLRAAGQTIATILHEHSPYFTPETIVTAVPTARLRIRQRGYDQAQLLASHWAALRGLEYKNTLRRQHQKRQLGASRAERLAQARTAFTSSNDAIKGRVIVLVDDVTTTGATLTQAAACLRAAGAEAVHGLVVAQQRLTESP